MEARGQRRAGSGRSGARALAVLALLLAACGASSDAADARRRGRGVLVIAVDALRADHLSHYGYDRATTPLLERLARRGLTLTNAWTPAPELIPAHAALLTGCDPGLARRPPLPEGAAASGVRTSWYVPPDVPRLAQSFLAGGWTTAAFVDHMWLGEARGFRQGFQTIEDPGESARLGAALFGVTGVAGRFVDWVRSLDEDERWFAYLHLNDLDRMWAMPPSAALAPEFEPRPELDFVPPVASQRAIFFAVPRARWSGTDWSLGEYEAYYDTGLRHLDRQLDRLVHEVDKLRGAGRTTVVITGSYGFGFGESGLLVDGGTLSDVDLRVPLIVRPEARLSLEPGRRIDALVSTMDLPPTLLAIAGIATPAGMHGRSFLPALAGDGPGPRERLVASCGVYPGYAVVEPGFLYEEASFGARLSSLLTSWYGIERPRREELPELRDSPRIVLKDLAADTRPGNLGRGVADPERAAAMRRAGEEWLRLVERARDVLQPLPWRAAPPDAEELEALRGAGMIGPLEL